MSGPSVVACRAVGPQGSLVDPATNYADLHIAQSVPFGRHLHAFLQAGDQADQWALISLPGNDHGRKIIAATHRGCAKIKPQTTLLLSRPMTTFAVLLKDGADIRFKVDLTIGGRWQCVISTGRMSRNDQ